MAPALRATALRCLALAGLAGAAALLANALAGPSRRLAWTATLAPLPAMAPRSAQPASLTPTPQPLAVQEAKAPPSPRPAPPTRPITAAAKAAETPTSQPPVATSPIREITGPEAWLAFQSKAPFLDARRSAEYTEGHIAGAWCAPVWEADLDDRLITFKAARRPGPEDPIVIYCSGGDCRDSHLLAAKLLNEGYFHLLIYRDGYPGWVAQGHPIDKGRP
jgi:rhodanese-related sulfurtransferase